MTVEAGPDTTTDGLVLSLDAANTKSYPGSGTTWTDLSGLGNNGTLNGGPTFNSGNNGYLSFDGVDDYISGGISTVSTWSMSLWYLSTDITSKVVFYPFSGTSTGTGIGFGGTFSVDTVNRWYFFDGTTVFSNSSTAIATNTWYNLVVTKTSTSYNLYTNGVLSMSSTGVNLSLTQYNIGRRGDNLFFVQGRVGQASIYNTALTQTQISINFNALRGRYGI